MIMENNISPYCMPGLIKSKPVTIEKIIGTVCEYFNITEKELKRRCRKTEVKFPRFMAIYLIYKEIEISSTNMGLIFKKDRTTIMHAFHTVENFISINDLKTISALNELKILIKQ
jgi:chromosomal replication initiation ATPase DnaA